MSSRRATNARNNIALNLIQAVAESSDVFPLLQSAAKDVLRIIQMLENLEGLQRVISAIAAEIERERALPWYERLKRFRHDPDLIGGMKVRIEAAIILFQVRVTAGTSVNVEHTLSAIRENTKITYNTERGVSSIAQDATLDRLRSVKGASWDMSRSCLENTRVKLIEHILAWIDGYCQLDMSEQPAGATIMLLTAVAGAGKTTVAHTIAGICAERHQLASSFFFDRETEGRNSPQALFSTIAADLSRRDSHIAERVAIAIKEDGSLPSAPVMNQFVELILKPCQKTSLTQPVVIVIDALDEAWDNRLLEILRDKAGQLPRIFRIFLTSRMRPELASLCDESHVRVVDLNIEDEANMSDMSLFVPHKLHALARDMRLGDGWPGEALTISLTERAGGLFQWIATVCEYLRQFSDPTSELKELLSSSDPTATTAEEKMDRLYALIIESFNWRDKAFVEGYHTVMGTAIASKTPMTISAMEELHHREPLVSEAILLRLSPLLTGMNKTTHTSQPVRMLHQSLRDYLVLRFSSSPNHTCFQITEKENSAKLALLCLNLMNTTLENGLSISGYLASQNKTNRSIPKLAAGEVSEALWYACRFWPDHVSDDDCLRGVQDVLARFLERNLVKWLELVSSYGECRDISHVWGRAEVSCNSGHTCSAHINSWAIKDSFDIQNNLRIKDSQDAYAKACIVLIDWLEYEDRVEESLILATQAVEIYRARAESDPEQYGRHLALSLEKKSWSSKRLGELENALDTVQQAVNIHRRFAWHGSPTDLACLAQSLRNLGNRYRGVGRYPEALAGAQEGVEIYEKLTEDEREVYVVEFAKSLHSVSGCYHDLGQHKESLKAIQRAVEIRRQLANEQSETKVSELALSLSSLSVNLYDMGRQHEALAAVEEAVEMYRRLAAKRQATYSPDLAMSLNNLSGSLSDMGRQNEALAAIEEAVEIRRRLAMERPAAYNPDLALSLNNLSSSLFKMGRQHEALAAIEEAVEMYRQLAVERPAAYTPVLVSSLNNFSNRLSDMGLQNEALAAIEEAVGIRRRLAIELPAAYTPDLALSLNNLSNRLYGVGRQNEALEVIEEAVEIRRLLAMERPTAYTPVLAGSLNNLSNRLSFMGRQNEALAAIEEAVEMYRRLAVERQAAYNPVLADSLNNLSNRLSDTGQHNEALATIEEAVEIRRNLTVQSPAAHNPKLAMNLWTLTLCLSNVGRHQNALRAIQESVQLYRSLLSESASYFTPYLTEALRMYSEVLAALNRDEEAAAARAEADRL
ncbi:hypothetical protein RhiJN_22397 [Ceratobasidium sp. AG-Ba]|nr:hypothetical protein RhiJN_22397 [Ceratobasidium sp. AG-Ba]